VARAPRDDARLAALEAELRRVSQQKDAELAKLRATVDALAKDRDAMRGELATLSGQRDAFKVEIASVARAREKLASELESFIREHTGTSPQIRTARQDPAVAAQLEELSRQQLELRERVEAAEKKLGQATSAPDDLRRIRGIGPRFEAALIERGIDSYAKIGAWTDENIDEVAKAIGTTPERIRREGWVANAKRLAGG